MTHTQRETHRHIVGVYTTRETKAKATRRAHTHRHTETHTQDTHTERNTQAHCGCLHDTRDKGEGEKARAHAQTTHADARETNTEIQTGTLWVCI